MVCAMLQIKDLILQPQLLKEAAEKLTPEQRQRMWPPEIGHQYHHFLNSQYDLTQLAAIEVRLAFVREAHCCSIQPLCRLQFEKA